MERRMRQVRRIGLAIAVVVAIAASYRIGRHYGHSEAGATSGRHVLYWVDPMHPAYKSDKPGIAPDCGMKLEPVYEGGSVPTAPSGKVLYYRDPKNPAYRSDKPGMNPATGEDLQPVYEGSPDSMPAGTINVGI